MQNRPPHSPGTERLADPKAARLPARASELDASSSAVADLRAAAVEAGISAQAFDAALAEMQSEAQAPVAAVPEPPRRRFGKRFGTVVFAALAMVIGVGMYARFRAAPNVAAVPGAPIIEETILLRCLNPVDASALLAPLVRENQNLRVTASPQPSRVITIRATQEQIQRVKALLDQYEAPGTATCPVVPGGNPPPPPPRP